MLFYYCQADVHIAIAIFLLTSLIDLVAILAQDDDDNLMITDSCTGFYPNRNESEDPADVGVTQFLLVLVTVSVFTDMSLILVTTDIGEALVETVHEFVLVQVICGNPV